MLLTLHHYFFGPHASQITMLKIHMNWNFYMQTYVEFILSAQNRRRSVVASFPPKLSVALITAVNWR